MAYRAELTGYITSPTCSPTPVLQAELDLPDAGWTGLRVSMETVAASWTGRQTISAAYVERALPRYLPAVPVTPVVPRWSTAHGDLHWASLTLDGPVLLDWEGWGLAPAGYDVALLAAHTLLAPATERRLRVDGPAAAGKTSFGHELTEHGRRRPSIRRRRAVPAGRRRRLRGGRR